MVNTFRSQRKDSGSDSRSVHNLNKRLAFIGIMYEDVLDIAMDAGKILMSYFGKKVEIKNKDTNHYSPVCIADIEANNLICKGLEKYGYQILSEELEEKNFDFSKPTWIVDPLDGTIGFLNKSKDFCTMIALMIDKKIVFGVVYLPTYDKLYYAEYGKGAWLIENREKKKIAVSNTENLDNSVRAVRPYSKPNFLDVILDEKLKCRNKIIGSIGVRLCVIAEGKIDFYVNTSGTPSKWDTAASHIIVEESGGKISDFLGKKLDYSKNSSQWENSFIVSNGKLHSQILNELPKNALRVMNRKSENIIR